METLLPFKPLSHSLELRAEIALLPKGLRFRFELADPQKLALDSLVPGSHAGPAIQRADLLWKTTCFEAFWARPGEKSYWEINLAASGMKWNCYHFDDYRQPIPPTASFNYEIVGTQVTENSLECEIRGNGELERIEASLCAIVRTAQGTHYFSKKHLRHEPNFHLRESFVLERKATADPSSCQ